MITRMWECRIVPGLVEEYVDFLRSAVLADMAEADGYVGEEIYRSLDGEPRLVVITHWRDEAALAAFAGPQWRDQPVVADDDQRDYLAGTPHVWHFTRLPGSG